MKKNDYSWDLDAPIAHAVEVKKGAHLSKNWTKEKQSEYNKWYYQTHKDKFKKMEQYDAQATAYENYGKKLRDEGNAAKDNANNYRVAAGKYRNEYGQNWREGNAKSFHSQSHIFDKKARQADLDAGKAAYKAASRANHNANKATAMADSEDKKAKEKYTRSSAAYKMASTRRDKQAKEYLNIEADKSRLSNKAGYAAYKVSKAPKELINKGKHAVDQYMLKNRTKKSKSAADTNYTVDHKKKGKRSSVSGKKWESKKYKLKSGKTLEIYD